MRSFAAYSVLILGLFAAASPAAQAQTGSAHGTYVWNDGTHHSPVYSGGQCVISDGVTPGTPIPYNSRNGVSAWGNNGQGAPTPTAGHTATESCSGAITATFTWKPDPSNPGELPPSSAVVQQDCQIQTYLSQGASATFDSGMGHTGYGYHDTLYTVKSSPGQSFVITPACSPSLTVTVPYPRQASGGTLTYTAAAFAVVVDLQGTTKDSNGFELLTGQLVTASLIAPYPIDQNSFAWSASGSMFKNYDWTLASNQKTELTDADYFRPTFTFYDATKETLTLTCSATVICPNGTRLSVTGSQKINSIKPTETKWSIGAAQAPNGPFFYDYDNGFYDPCFGVQVTWYPITITVPSPFSGGQVCLAQIGSFNRVDTRVALHGASSTYVVIPDTQGLDTGFPYKIAYQLDANGNLVLDNNGLYTLLSPPQWNIAGSGPSSGAGGDRPSISCEPDLVDGDTGGDDWRTSTVTDQFDTWTMYRPPASGGQPTIWVPLQKIHWGWSGSAQVHTDAGGNVILYNDGYAQWFYAIPTINPAGTPANTATFPMWNAVIPYGLTMGPPAVH